MNQLVNNIVDHLHEGGFGSGFYGHLGRLGKKGGSLPRLAGKSGRPIAIKKLFPRQADDLHKHIKKLWTPGSRRGVGEGALLNLKLKIGGPGSGFFGHFTKGKLSGMLELEGLHGVDDVVVNRLASGYPKQGIGTELMAKAAKTASRKGRGLELWAEKDSRLFYEKLGMREDRLGHYVWTPEQARNFWKSYERTMGRKV